MSFLRRHRASHVAVIVIAACVAQTEYSGGVRAQDASAPAPSATTNLVTSGASWKYLDDGSNQAVDWRAPGFDDTSLAAGPASSVTEMVRRRRS